MRLVIAGGGFCGSVLAKKFDSRDEFETTLIDENGTFEFYPSIPKLITDPEYESKVRLKFDSILFDTNVVEEELKRITPEFVETSEDRFDFDYLVICTGADYPIRLDNTEDVFTANNFTNASKINQKIERSKSVLIIGGGLIGVEVASELACKTDKEISLVHPHSRLIERNPKSASKHAENFLKRRNVRLIFDDKVVRNEDDFHTEKGETIRADTAIWCAGLGFDPSFLDGFDDQVIEDKGLKVDRNLRLKGYDEIFAGGDITSLAEEKTGHNADRHARLIYDNIIKDSKGKRLSKYRKRESPLVISLGRSDGIFTFRSFSAVGLLPALAKYIVERVGIGRLRL